MTSFDNMKKNYILATISAMLLFTSCNSSFWEGMAAGMVSGAPSLMYGGVGSVYNSGSALYGGVPYSLQPEVAVEQATQVINNNLAAQMRADAEETQRIQQNMQNQFSNFWDNVTVNPDVPIVAPDINNGGAAFPPSTTPTPTSTYEGNSSGPHTSTCHLCHGYKKCTTCNGNRIFLPGASSTYVKCPNCTDGLCHACHGTGRSTPHYY